MGVRIKRPANLEGMSVIAVSDPNALGVAEAALRAGGVVVLPTDTVYGLAARPEEAAAIERIYELKDRPPSMPIATLIDGLDQVGDALDVPPEAERLAAAFWPGALTLVLACAGGSGTLGVRCPDHEFVRALARRTGPLAVTSANRHGRPTPRSAQAAAADLHGDVDVVIDGGECAGVASTVVDLTTDPLTIIRSGPITPEEVRVVALR